MGKTTVDVETFDDTVDLVRNLSIRVNKLEAQLARLWQLAEDEGALDDVDLSDFEVPDVDE